jgi:hypothetical protein
MHIVKKAHEIHSHAVKVYPRSQLKEHRSLQYNLTVLIGSEMTERTLVLISYSVQHHVAYADKKKWSKSNAAESAGRTSLASVLRDAPETDMES